jgi:hypothetical protein
MNRAEAIAVKWASQSLRCKMEMDLAAEIRLAIVEAEQAAAREMRDRCIAAREDAYQSTGMNWWEEEMCTLPLPHATLDLALERARLEEHEMYCTKDVFVFYERGILPCAPGQSHETGYDHYLCSKEHPCPRRKELDAAISALEQAQRDGKEDHAKK